MGNISGIWYVISTLVYIGMGTNSLSWSMFNMLSILVCICLFLYNTDPINDVVKTSAILITLQRIVYTMVCAGSTAKWVYATNIYFVLIFFFTFILLVSFKYVNVKK